MPSKPLKNQPSQLIIEKSAKIGGTYLRQAAPGE